MVEIRPSSVDEFFAHPCAKALLSEYALECANRDLPEPKPDRELYRAIEKVGILHVIAAFEGDQMLGFVTLLVARNMHYSALIANTESIFVAAAHRSGDTGGKLLTAARNKAIELGAVGLYVTAPVGARLNSLMIASHAYRTTNHVYFSRLA